jgi:hypothetical protein
MKSSIRRKVQMLFELDIPLLIKNNFIASTESDREALAWAESTRPSKSSLSYKSLGKVEVLGSKLSQGSFFFFLSSSSSAIITG